MDEAWERAVEAARGGEDPASVRSLTLDSALKCSQGRLPSASLLEQFSQLRVLSIANVGLASVAEFPSLPHLERLILSDNRIAGGLEFLVEAGLHSLRDLDLSNNKIQLVEDLAPLAQLNLLSLDLYECPVTRSPNYRAKVFSLIKSLQYLDKADAEDNERPESDEEEEEDEDDVEDELGDGLDVDGDDEDLVKFVGRAVGSTVADDEDEVDEEDEKDEDGEESDELDEEDEEGVRYPGVANNFARSNDDSGSEEEVDDEEDAENVEVQDIEESEEEEGADDEEDAGDGEEEDEDDDEEEEEGTELASGAFGSAEGEIDAQDDGEDENGEVGDEDEDADEGVDNDDGEDDEDEEEDYGTEYLVQPIARAEEEEGASDFEPGEDEDEDEEDVDEDEQDDEEPATASLKRKRAKDQDDDSDQDERHPKR